MLINETIGFYEQKLRGRAAQFSGEGEKSYKKFPERGKYKFSGEPHNFQETKEL